MYVGSRSQTQRMCIPFPQAQIKSIKGGVATFPSHLSHTLLFFARVMEPDSFTAFAEMLVNRVSDLEQRVRMMEMERNEQDMFRLQEHDQNTKHFVRNVDGTLVRLAIERKCIGDDELVGDIQLFFEGHEWAPFDADRFIKKLPSWKPVIDCIVSSEKDDFDVTIDDLSEEAKEIVDLDSLNHPMCQLECEFMRVHFKDDIRYFKFGDPVFKTGGRLKTMEDLFVVTKEYIEELSDRKQKRIDASISKAEAESDYRLWEKFLRTRDLDVICSATRGQAVKFLSNQAFLDRSQIRAIVEAHGIREIRDQSPIRYSYK